MKECSKCHVTKPVDGFYRDKRTKDGRFAECKECFRTREREKYHSDEATRKRKSDWAKNKRDKEKHSKYNQKYTKTERGKEVQRRGKKKYIKKHPERIRAKNLVHYHVRQGHIPPISTLQCDECNKQATDYHHPDYSKPLYVIPLCRECHINLHNEMKQ